MTSGAVVFVAFGTRGDVQPLAVLATAFAAQTEHAVTFITHEAHESVLLRALSASGVRFVGLSSLPAAVWRGESAGSHRWQDEAREECVSAVCEFFSRRGDGGGGALLAYNLFALEAASLAERLRVPSIALSPYLIPNGASSTAFDEAFTQLLPVAAHALRHAPPGTLGWREVQHWMWPLWTERWGEWRAERLGLPALPLDCEPLVLPPPTKLLYGFSARLVARPGYWPESVSIVGAWLPPAGWELGSESEEAYAPPPALQAFLSTSEGALSRPVAAITFGSMASIDGAIAHPHTLLACLAAALDAANLRGVLLMDAGSSLAAACTSGEWPKLLCVAASVPHPWLLPRCALLLHHGGSGTTAAALRAGIPQVTVPFMFDQHLWAESVAYAGVAVPPLSRAVIVPYDTPHGQPAAEQAARALTEALRAATAPELVAAARAWSERERAEEDGVTAAVAVMALEALRGDAATTALAARELHATPRPKAPVKAPPVSHLEMGGMRLAVAGAPEDAQHVYNEVFVDDVYLRRGFEAALPAGALVVDVGAHIGLFSLRLAALFAARRDTRARVLALEPLPSTFAALSENTAGVGCITPLQLGIVAGAVYGTAVFTLWPRMPGNATLHADEKRRLQQHAVSPRFWAGETEVRCPVTTLSALWANHLAPDARVALLKVDVEGAELDVLSSLQAAQWARVDACVVEVHDLHGRAEQAAAMLVAGGLSDVFIDRQVLQAAGVPAGVCMLYARRT